MKKILSLILSTLLLISATSVFAEPIKAGTDFEDGVLPDVFINNNLETESITLPDGTKALKLVASNQLSHIYIDSTNMASDDKYIISFDAMLKKLPSTDSDKSIFIFGSSPHNGTAGIVAKYKTDGTVVFMDGTTEKGTFVKDKWYKVVILKDGSGNGNGYTYITDDEGNTISRKYWMSPGITPFKFAPIIVPYGVSTDAEMVIDNLVFGCTKAADAPEYVISTVPDGKNDVLRNQKISVSFNQELDPSSYITVKDSEGAEVLSDSTVCINSIDIGFKSLLEKGETYTLSFENVKNKSSVTSLSEGISFKTEETHIMSAPEILSAVSNGDKTKITFNVKDPYG